MDLLLSDASMPANERLVNMVHGSLYLFFRGEDDQSSSPNAPDPTIFRAHPAIIVHVQQDEVNKTISWVPVLAAVYPGRHRHFSSIFILQAR